MRSLPEWVGSTSDAAIPPRVTIRVFQKFGGKCQCGCGRSIRIGEKWQVDHIIALINGGTHSEGNLQPLLTAHHRKKTKADVATKSKIARTRARHLGIRKRSSFLTNKDGPFRKRIDGTVERR